MICVFEHETEPSDCLAKQLLRTSPKRRSVDLHYMDILHCLYSEFDKQPTYHNFFIPIHDYYMLSINRD